MGDKPKNSLRRCRYCGECFPAYYLSAGGVCEECRDGPRGPRLEPRSPSVPAVDRVVVTTRHPMKELQALFKSLSPHQRQVYALYYGEAHPTQAAVAAQLMISQPAVAKTLRLIRARFARRGIPEPRHPREHTPWADGPAAGLGERVIFGRTDGIVSMIPRDNPADVMVLPPATQPGAK